MVIGVSKRQNHIIKWCLANCEKMLGKFACNACCMICLIAAGVCIYFEWFCLPFSDTDIAMFLKRFVCDNEYANIDHFAAAWMCSAIKWLGLKSYHSSIFSVSDVSNFPYHQQVDICSFCHFCGQWVQPLSDKSCYNNVVPKLGNRAIFLTFLLHLIWDGDRL